MIKHIECKCIKCKNSRFTLRERLALWFMKPFIYISLIIAGDMK